MSQASKRHVRDWEAFLATIAVRRALDQLRVRCRSRKRHSPTDAGDRAAAGETPEQCLQNTELVERLREALTELPQLQAEVFCLRAFNDLSYQEIGVELGLLDKHVGVLLHRARQTLQVKLNDFRPVATLENPYESV